MALTIAERLGSTPHLSPLLRKARRLGLQTPHSLLRLAVRRGCAHYAPPDYTDAAVNDPGRELLSDVELAIALCSGAQGYDPVFIRCAAQLLSGDGIHAGAVVRLARMERCETVIAQIAAAGADHDSERKHFWLDVLSHLRRDRTAPAGVLPHWSRYMIQTGVTGPGRFGRACQVWLRPRMPFR